MYPSGNTRSSSDPTFIHTYISQFVEWMKSYVQIPDSGDLFQILSDIRSICKLIVVICPLQAMMDSSQLDNPDTDIESTYTYLCDRLNIPIQFRLSRDLFVNHNVQALVSCLQALIASFVLYNSPDKLNLPPVLIENYSMRSSSTPSFYGDNQTYISHPPPGYSRPTQGPSPYYPGMIPPSYPNYYRNGYNENCSHTSSSIPTLSVVTSLDSNGASSLSRSPSRYNSNIVQNTPLFTASQSRKQASRQKEFLEQLEQEKKKKQENVEEEQERETFTSNQLDSPRNNSSHQSMRRSNSSDSTGSNDSIAEETITPCDKHVEKSKKKKKFWNTVVGIGATVGIVAGAVVATTLAMKNKDEDEEDEEDD